MSRGIRFGNRFDWCSYLFRKCHVTTKTSRVGQKNGLWWIYLLWITCTYIPSRYHDIKTGTLYKRVWPSVACSHAGLKSRVRWIRTRTMVETAMTRPISLFLLSDVCNPWTESGFSGDAALVDAWKCVS